jgi:hypothetical protein
MMSPVINKKGMRFPVLVHSERVSRSVFSSQINPDLSTGVTVCGDTINVRGDKDGAHGLKV